MDAGDKLRFYGPNGAPFVVTVGASFTPRYIRAQLEAGEWRPFEPETTEAPAGGPPAKPAPVKRGRPRKNP
jgi:hypothetical protein